MMHTLVFFLFHWCYSCPLSGTRLILRWWRRKSI